MGPFVGATMAPGSIGARISDAIFSGLDRVHPGDRRRHRHPARAAEPGRHRQGVGRRSCSGSARRSSGLIPTRRRARAAGRRRAAAGAARARSRRRRSRSASSPCATAASPPSTRCRSRVQPGRDHRPDRTQRRRQDLGDRRHHRVHARSATGTSCSTARRSTGCPPAKRARAGLSRSFQSLELFEDSTVLDNLRAASDPRDRLSYLRDLVRPVDPPLPGEVVAAIHEFQLEDDLHRDGAGPVVRPAAPAGDRPRRRHAAERAAARRAGRRPRRRRDRPSWRTSCAASPTTGAWPSCSSSTT